MPSVSREKLIQYRNGAKSELYEDILPFWMRHALDNTHGGFYGAMANDLTVDPESPKSAVLCTRILWTYSAAYRITGDGQYLSMCQRAMGEIENRFWDKTNGGLYWWLDFRGNPLETDKKMYAQAFAIYALAEHYRSVHTSKSLDLARRLYETIEEKGRDLDLPGYFDFFNADWSPKGNATLSDDTDLPAEKTMNTHLHILEGYAGLYRIWRDDALAGRLRSLIDIHLDRILNPETGHLRLFFDRGWKSISEAVSYGHDIEASWLLCEAAHILGDKARMDRTEQAALHIAKGVMLEAQDKDGGIFNEGGPGGAVVDTDKHWWPQAEAAVGFLNAYHLSGDAAFLDASMKSWGFIQEKLVDRKYGEWFWKTDRNGTPDNTQPKVSPWKCPYHNGRACMEIMERLDAILKK